jgi:hypothetical protein
VCANVSGVATCVADTSKNDQTCSTSKCLVGETCLAGVAPRLRRRYRH